MTFGVGKILSLILATIVMLLIVLFFARKKSMALMYMYLSVYLIFIGLYVLSWYYVDMDFTLSLMNSIIVVMIVIAVVVYQSEFKKIFFNLSKLSQKSSSLVFSDEELQKSIEELVRACQQMSKARTGALIVIVPTKISQNVLDSGVQVGGLLTASLLESIFNTRAPMHDGAVVVKGNKILAAGCFLPLTQAQAISKELGTRHRAAIGITEENDNLSIVVSEENGIISVAKKGVLRRYITPERLSDILYETFNVSVRTRGMR